MFLGISNYLPYLSIKPVYSRHFTVTYFDCTYDTNFKSSAVQNKFSQVQCLEVSLSCIQMNFVQFQVHYEIQLTHWQYDSYNIYHKCFS